MSKKMRLRPEPLHAPRAAQQHAHPAPPMAHCTHADSCPCGQGAGDCGPSPGSPSPVVLHDLCACPGTRLECVSSGVWQAGLPRGLSPRLGSDGTQAVGKVGTRGALETPLGSLARPEAGGKEPRWQVEAWLTTTAETSCWGLGRPGPAVTAWGGFYPAHLREGAARARVC